MVGSGQIESRTFYQISIAFDNIYIYIYNYEFTVSKLNFIDKY